MGAVGEVGDDALEPSWEKGGIQGSEDGMLLVRSGIGEGARETCDCDGLVGGSELAVDLLDMLNGGLDEIMFGWVGDDSKVHGARKKTHTAETPILGVNPEVGNCFHNVGAKGTRGCNDGD